MTTDNTVKKSVPSTTLDTQEAKGIATDKGDYTPSLENLPLSQSHYDMLKASAISDDVIRERGYRTITDAAELRELGFSRSQERAPGLLLPLHDTLGKTPIYVYRPDNPRVHEDKKHRDESGQYKNKVIKYEMPKGEDMRLDVPPRCLADLGNPSKPLWITEGQKKADALASAGLCTVALLGVWNFIGKNEQGGKVFLHDWRDIALNDGRPVRIVFDSDVMVKPEVKQAMAELTAQLQRRGATVEAVYLPGGKESKVGVDDWLADGHTVADLEALVETPRLLKQAIPLVVELLDEAPLMIRRPLSLVKGKAYAAIWPYARRLIPQKIVPGYAQEYKEVKGRSLHVVCSDGAIYGDASMNKMDALGIDVELSEPPSGNDSLWSTPSVKSYEKGYRPDPINVFERVKSVIARFIDFDRSLASQETMAEMLACFAISTWFLDAFSVAPYIWVNGERGSGKTSLLFVLVRLSYLGSSLSPSGSFAALRDLADYGATLGLDDAEDLTDPKKSDPDKRAILLSGNRRGVTVPLKEPSPDGQGWKTREVNCFCPRIFSTIQKPDPTLSSRAIIVPVVRTAQRSKGNADPLDDMQWPCDRQALIDDLWAVSLAHLAEMPGFDKLIGEKSKLIGRDLQPWRAILSVAAWLDGLGVSGLWRKIEALAAGTYQEERHDLEKVDINRIAMRALGEFAARAPSKSEWSFSTQAIVELIHRLIDDEEIELSKDVVNSQMLGHRFKKMRFSKDDNYENTRPRLWKITRPELATLLSSYRIPIAAEIARYFGDSALGNIGDIGYIGDIGTNDSNLTNDSNVVLTANPKFPEKPCYACQSTAWYIGPGGNVICGVCHPAPKSTTAG
jgi:hypothetical protein